MNRINQKGIKIAAIVVFLLSASCAPPPKIDLLYRAPRQTEGLKGKSLFLRVEDERTSKDMIGRGAKKDFAEFPGNVYFEVAKGYDEGSKIGVYEIPQACYEAFKIKLESMGIVVATDKANAQAEIVISLKEFMLDLQRRTWKAYMAYEASLIKDGKVYATENINGQAERFKVFRLREANIVVSEIFTDIVNKLDIEKLLKKSEL